MPPCESFNETNKTDFFPMSTISGAVESGLGLFDTAMDIELIKDGHNCTRVSGKGNCVGEPKLNKFQIIKAVVLAGVTAVIMISICRMVFHLFVRYNVRHDR